MSFKFSFFSTYIEGLIKIRCIFDVNKKSGYFIQNVFLKFRFVFAALNKMLFRFTGDSYPN